MYKTRILISQSLKSLKSIKYDLLFWIITFSLLVKQIIFMKWCVFNYSWNDLILKFPFKPVILVYLAYTLIFTSICFIFSKRYRIWYLLLIDLFISLLIIWSIAKTRMTSSYFSVLIGYESLSLYKIKEILSYLTPKDFILLLDIVVLYPFSLFFKSIYKHCKKSIITFILILFICVSYLFSVHYKVDLHTYSKLSQSLYYNFWNDGDREYYLGIVGHELHKFFNYATTYNCLKEDESKKLDAYFDSKKQPAKNDYFGKFKDKNIIFLQLESFESFVLNEKVNGEEITPNLNKLLNNSIYFPNIYPANNLGVSSDCDFLINTGLYPSRYGQTFYDFPRNQYPNALPKLLSKSNYYSASYHCDYGYYWNAYENLLKFGFNELNTFKDFKEIENFSLGIPDHEFLPQVAEKISKLPNPFFAHAITVSGHSPFYITDNHKKLNLPSNLSGTIFGDFLQTTKYTDESIGQFIKKLDDLNLSDDTILFIFGDHGGIHKYHNDKIKNNTDLDSWWFGDEKIPLIIYNKNISKNVNTNFGSQVDFYPTLAYLLGIDDKWVNYTLGENLFKDNKDYVNVNGTIYGHKNSEIESKEKYILDINQSILEKNYLNKKLR